MGEFTALRTAFQEDGVALGADARTFEPIVIELFGTLGLDYVWLDYEHAGPTLADGEHVEGICRAAAAAGIEPVVRLPSGGPDQISKVLDAGVRSIVVPQVETAAEVREVVSAARFPGETTGGERGIGLVRSNRWGSELEGYTERENDSINVGVMIENEAAIESIEEILAVDGLGFVFLGPADLSLSMRGRYEPTAPEVTDAIETVLEEANAADVPVGRSFGSIEAATDAIEAGYRMLSIGRDLSAIRETLKPRVSALR